MKREIAVKFDAKSSASRAKRALKNQMQVEFRARTEYPILEKSDSAAKILDFEDFGRKIGLKIEIESQ